MFEKFTNFFLKKSGKKYNREEEYKLKLIEDIKENGLNENNEVTLPDTILCRLGLNSSVKKGIDKQSYLRAIPIYHLKEDNLFFTGKYEIKEYESGKSSDLKEKTDVVMPRMTEDEFIEYANNRKKESLQKWVDVTESIRLEKSAEYLEKKHLLLAFDDVDNGKNTDHYPDAIQKDIGVYTKHPEERDKERKNCLKDVIAFEEKVEKARDVALAYDLLKGEIDVFSLDEIATEVARKAKSHFEDRDFSPSDFDKIIKQEAFLDMEPKIVVAGDAKRDEIIKEYLHEGKKPKLSMYDMVQKFSR